MTNRGSLFPDSTPSESATMSSCGKYRYVLRRIWDAALPAVAWIMLNPSTADAFKDDPTIRRVIRFSREWGAGGCIVVNLFALRSTNPELLRSAVDPVGPDNDRHINFETTPPFVQRRVIAAWGSHPAAASRVAAVMKILAEAKVSVECLNMTRTGHPRHPLFVPAGTQPIPFIWKG